MIEEFVSRSFALRDAAHLAHWATRSYSEHVALGEFYDSLLEKTDSLVEAYQGCFGLIGKVKPKDYAKDNIVKQIADTANWLAENREKLADDNAVIENQIDELGLFFAHAHYKLKFLS